MQQQCAAMIRAGQWNVRWRNERADVGSERDSCQGLAGDLLKMPRKNDQPANYSLAWGLHQAAW